MTTTPKTQHALAQLLAEIERPIDFLAYGDRAAYDRHRAVEQAAKRVRDAMAEDELASWRIPRKPRIHGNTITNPIPAGIAIPRWIEGLEP